MVDHRWIRIASYSSNNEAALALSVLEGSGIPAKIFNQHALGAMPHLSQMIMADLMVDETSVTDALEILGIHSATALPAQETNTETQTSDRYRAARKVMLIAALASVLLVLILLEMSK
jgi:hypothetical protein